MSKQSKILSLKDDIGSKINDPEYEKMRKKSNSAKDGDDKVVITFKKNVKQLVKQIEESKKGPVSAINLTNDYLLEAKRDLEKIKISDKFDSKIAKKIETQKDNLDNLKMAIRNLNERLKELEK